MRITTYETKIFICDICGREHLSKEACLNCESSHGHQTVQNVIKYEYKKNSIYPNTVTLCMSNGVFLKYKLLRG